LLNKNYANLLRKKKYVRILGLKGEKEQHCDTRSGGEWKGWEKPKNKKEGTKVWGAGKRAYRRLGNNNGGIKYLRKRRPTGCNCRPGKKRIVCKRKSISCLHPKEIFKERECSRPHGVGRWGEGGPLFPSHDN